MNIRTILTGVTLIPAALLAGCVRFGGEAPKQLLTLNAERAYAAGAALQAAPGSAVTVLDPDAPKKLDTVRIPVNMGENGLAYIKGSAWVDTPRRMFQRLLSETIASSGRLVMDPGQFTTDPGTRLMGQLIDFGIDEPTKTATVTYDAIRLSADGRVVSKRRFQASSPVQGKIAAASAAQAINHAANQVAGEVAEWIGQ